MFYFFCAQEYSLSGLCFIVMVVLGNSLGGMLIPARSKLAGEGKK